MELQHKQLPVKASHGMLKNSAWGIGGNILQVVFVSLFFAIVARKYATGEFAAFLISTTIYQLVAAFSSMGLGQWYIRKYIAEKDKFTLTGKFFKTQIGLGFLFYLINLTFAYTLYPDGEIRLLSIILGTNIIFDNIINAIKSLNIVEGRQDKTAAIMVLDGFFKLMVGSLLFINPFSAVILALLLIAVRILTLWLFIKIGSSFSLGLIQKAKLSIADLKFLILKNWRFMIIGSVSIIYWRVGNIIISKTLALHNVAAYELSFRIFSIFQILPVIASATIYPQFIKYVNENNTSKLKQLYSLLFFGYTGAAVLAYGFIFSFSGMIIPFAFGTNYPDAIACLQQMFLAFLIMPTVLLQANLIIALGLERKDMQFNIISLIVNVGGCLIAVYFYKSLAVINYSIFTSLIVFHILQDFVLVKKRIITIRHCLFFYLIIAGAIISFRLLPNTIGLYHFYFLFTAIVILIIVIAATAAKKIIAPFFNKQLEGEAIL